MINLILWTNLCICAGGRARILLTPPLLSTDKTVSKIHSFFHSKFIAYVKVRYTLILDDESSSPVL